MPQDGTEELRARFQREVSPLLDRLSARAMSLTHHKHDAEDLLQDTMLFAYKGFHSYREGTNLIAWLMRIMHNRWISQCRRQMVRPETSIGDFTDSQVPPTRVLASRSAESLAMEAMPDPDLHGALMGLQDDTRTVMFYVHFEDLSHKQIAQRLGVPAGTVMSRAHRGRQQLLSALGDFVRCA